MRYPLIEATTAGLFAGVAARIGFSWSLPAYLVGARGVQRARASHAGETRAAKRCGRPAIETERSVGHAG